MKVEDLLKPRFKVIADYPYSPYEVGEQIEFSNIGTTFHCTTTRIWSDFYEDFVDSKNYFHIDKLAKYPHLFKKLHWCEERPESDLPKYIGVKNQDGVFNWICPVVRYTNISDEQQPWSCIISFTNLQGQYEEIEQSIWSVYPAVEQEYLNHIKTITPHTI